MLANYPRLFSLVVLALVSSLVLTPLCFNHCVPSITEFFNHTAAIMQAKQALAEGQFPLRVAPLEQEGWRYPLFQFYSPSSYTLAGLIYAVLTPSDPFLAYKLTLWLSLMLGGIYLLRLSLSLNASRPLALLVSIAYLTNPYLLIVINHLAAFNEACALGLVPVVLFYSFQRYQQPAKDSSLLKAGLAWYLLATTHLLTYLASSGFILGLFFLLSLSKPGHYRYFIALLLAYFFAVFLALWYLAPIVLLSKDFLVSQSTNAAFFLPLYRVPLLDLLSPTVHILPGVVKPLGGVSSITRIHPGLGLATLFVLLASSFLVFKRKVSHPYFPALFFLLLFSLFIAWSPFNFWRFLPSSFFILQYPWRILGQSMWLSALLLLCFPGKKASRSVYLFMLALLASSLFVLPGKETPFISIKPYLATLSSSKEDYLLPIHVFGKTKDLEFLKHSEILDLKQVLPHCHQKGELSVCVLKVPQGTEWVELPLLYYPELLDIRLNGKPVAYQKILVDRWQLAAIKPLAGEVNTIDCRFRGLAWANWASLISWLLWLLACALWLKSHKT